MEDAEVDEGVGGHEEVGEEAAHHVEVADDDAHQGDDEHQDVPAHGVVVLAATLSERVDTGEDLVLGNGLEHSKGIMGIEVTLIEPKECKVSLH